MKRSEVINIIGNFIYERGVDHEECAEEAEKLLKQLEVHMEPKKYINPKAYKDEGIISPKGEVWSHLAHIDKYPDHHYTHKNKKPYEFYLEGWEPEDEE